MPIPGSNILNQALRVIAAQNFSYFAFTGRATNDTGLIVATYARAVSVKGSWQPVPRSMYEVLGLDLQKNYANAYVRQDIIDVERDVSGDQFSFNGQRYQCESATKWEPIDGWVQVLCVQVVG